MYRYRQNNRQHYRSFKFNNIKQLRRKIFPSFKYNHVIRQFVNILSLRWIV